LFVRKYFFFLMYFSCHENTKNQQTINWFIIDGKVL